MPRWWVLAVLGTFVVVSTPNAANPKSPPPNQPQLPPPEVPKPKPVPTQPAQPPPETNPQKKAGLKTPPLPKSLPRYGEPFGCSEPPCYVVYEQREVGRMNNQRIAMRQGLLIAYALNRTLVIPRWGGDERVEDYIDVDMMRTAWPVLTIDEFRAIGGASMPTFHVGALLDSLLHFRQHKGPAATPEQLRSELSRHEGSNKKVIQFNQAFNYRLNHSEAVMLWLLSRARSAPWIRQEAARFIQEHLTPPFLAYHSRHLGGECEGRAAKAGMPPTACEHTAKQAEEFLGSIKGITPASYFLGSDRERPDVDKEMVERLGFVMYEHSMLPPERRSLYSAHGLVDYEIMCESNWFVGSWLSTLSLGVSIFRQSTGRWSQFFVDLQNRAVQYT